MLPLGSAWAAHDCCGHSADVAQATGADTENPLPGNDCLCTCCQAETATSVQPGISFQFDSWWSIETEMAIGDSRFETDIFRPPLA